VKHERETLPGPNKEGTRYYNDKGEVGVLISPGYGAGWSTWNDHEIREQFLFDPGLITLVLQNKSHIDLQLYAEQRWAEVHSKGELYCGGLSCVRVVWLPPGSIFRIKERDGNERMEHVPREDSTFCA